MAGNFENMLSTGEHIAEDKLQNYMEGNLSAIETHQVEKHLLECELCSDSLEALKMMMDPASREIISGLNKKIDDRVESYNDRKGTVITFKPYYRIAAVITLFILFGGGYWWLKKDHEEKILAENSLPVSNAKTDSVSAQFVPKGSSDQKAVEPIPTNPQFSLPEKKSTPLPLATTKAENNQIVKNDIEKNKDDDIKPLNDNSLLRDQNTKDEAKAANEGLAKQSTQSVNIESEARSAAPSIQESATSFQKEKVNRKESPSTIINADGIIADKPVTLFARGKSNYEAKKYTEATIDFERLLNDTASAYYDDAKWLLANCYAKTYNNAKSRKLLKEIARSKSVHQKEAQGLLQESQ